MNVSIVVLSRYPDLFASFKESVETFEPEVEKILVRDGQMIGIPDGWRVIDGREPFNYSHNVNLGWWMATHDDVLLSGDDVRFSSPFIAKMRTVAYSDPTIGFVVPELGGQSCFVCAYIKRELISAVGGMDEQFDGYGMQDNDYYRRFEALGYRTQPIELPVEHHGGTSFYRRAREGGESVQAQCDRMKKIYDEKWSA